MKQFYWAVAAVVGSVMVGSVAFALTAGLVLLIRALI